MVAKQEIRKKILAIRDGMPEEQRRQYSLRIKEKIEEMDCYRTADAILAYVSYRSEVDTRGLIEHALSEKKAVFAPKVRGDEMEFWKIEGLADLQEGYRGIFEPKEEISLSDWMKEQSCFVMMWMPGAVFDIERHRLGYGKGFYDRYLSGFLRDKDRIRLMTAGLAFSCQIVDRVPCEPHDIRPDFVVTERKIVR